MNRPDLLKQCLEEAEQDFIENLPAANPVQARIDSAKMAAFLRPYKRQMRSPKQRDRFIVAAVAASFLATLAAILVLLFSFFCTEN